MAEASLDQVRDILREVLNLGARAERLERESALMGHIPELDSMAVVSIITTIEERFGVMVDDDEIDADTFQTVGTLMEFVQTKLDD